MLQEYLLGMPSRFVFCGRYTILTDELSKLTKDTSTLVISCLTGIVSNLMSSSDVKLAIEKAMGSIGAMLRDLVRKRLGLRIIVAHCTPRDIQDFDVHSKFAMVTSTCARISYHLSESEICLSLLPALFARCCAGQ
jgi:hypothetical protein